MKPFVAKLLSRRVDHENPFLSPPDAHRTRLHNLGWIVIPVSNVPTVWASGPGKGQNCSETESTDTQTRLSHSQLPLTMISHTATAQENDKTLTSGAP